MSNPPAFVPGKSSALAVWSLVCGVLTFICFGPFAALPAIILGHLALSAIKQAAGLLAGKGMAIAGFVMGYVGLLLSLLVVPALLLPAFQGAGEAVRHAKAAGDIQGIVASVKAFQTEYGSLPQGPNAGVDATFAGENSGLFKILSGTDREKNPKQIFFFEARKAIDPAHPKSGFGADGVLYDPWGTPYFVRVDSNGDGKVEDPYTGEMLDETVIVWSFGKDQLPGKGGNKDGSQDIRSWALRPR